MTTALEINWVFLALLSSLRIAGILISTPVLGFSSVPLRIKVFMVVGLGAIGALFSQSAVELPVITEGVEVLLAAAAELLLGVSMGFGLLSVFGAYMLAGRLLDYQMGFGISAVFDPATQEQTSLNGTLLSMIAAVAFLTFEAHHTLIQGVAYSFSAVPIGNGGIPSIALLSSQFGLMFVFGFLLAAPAVVGLMLVDFGVGVASRLMPQVNAYFVALPVKVYTGIVLLAISMNYMEPVVRRSFEVVFSYWQRLLPGVA